MVLFIWVVKSNGNILNWNVTLMFFRERKYPAEPSAEQEGLCAAAGPVFTSDPLGPPPDFMLKREDRIGGVTNFCATLVVSKTKKNK